MISYLIWFLSAAAGCLFFCLSMRSPRRALLPTSLVAGLAYALYMLVEELTHLLPLAYFLATLFVAVAGEVLARGMRMPATIFLFPAVLPMVPGIGIYRTMLYLLRSEYEAFLDTGTETLLALGAMAVAIALTNEIARRFSPVLRPTARKERI